MNCAVCGHDNPERAKFCLECGAPFAARCGSCGVELPPAAKFCLECGTRVGAAPSAPARPAESPGARTVVSIVFADLVGSTALHERLDAEAVRQFMERYYAAMRGAVEGHGGRVTQVMGDGVKAVFGAPRVAEDDAIRAVRAAVAMQDAFRTLANEQRGRVGNTGLRVAVNTGEVVSDGESEIIGDPVNVAARLQEQGKDGDVVIGGATQRIVAALVTLERLGSFALKGRSEQVEAYRVVSLDPPEATKAAFVGRDAELARLSAVYETAVAKPAAQLAVLLGSPGLGKSRLIDEFARRLGEGATVLTAHCDAAGGATFAPLAAALREHLGVEDSAKPEALRAALEAVVPGEDAERTRIVSGVAALLSGLPASPEETFFVVRRLLAALATAKPVVLVIDDLHWAESLLLDLVEHLVQWGSGVPLLVLVGARPELRELRSSLVVPGGLVGDVLTLAGLDAGAAMRLAAGVIGAADLPAALAAKLLASSEGNPLFVGELVKMLVQEGVLQRDGERWVASAALADLEMPPTIHALLAARIERLRPEERAVLERAAVVGRHFSKSAVAALLASTSELDARLEALRRSELIERDTGWYLGEPVLRFHHVLIRDAAYRRVLKGTRAELHARLAGWIEGKAGDAAEYDETTGWHLEQAHQHLRELGPLDATGVALGERAAQRLAAAGRRALARDDLALAANLLGRALACLPATAEERADLALDWCEALLSTGDVGPAANALEELARAGADSERMRAWHTCFAGQLSTLTSPQGLQATADSVAAAAVALASLGDAAGEAKAHFVNAQALARLGKVGACEAALDLALAAARRAGDRRRANAVLAGAPRAALWGPSPVTRASGRCLDVVRVLRITQGAPAVEAVALSCQGVLEALRGRTDAAKRMIASARKLVEELGIAQRLFEADVFAGRVALLEGDAGAAAASLRGAYEGLRDLGLGIDAAQAAALLARALLAQGRAVEAEALSHESEALAGDDLQAAIAWRGARAEALAQRGEHEAAVVLARAAVEIASATDALLDHADARVALAAALRAAGRGAEADAELRRARELWETKGATLLAERAAREGARVGGAAVVPAVAPAPTRRRRVRPNAATESAARLDAAIAARNGDALLDLFADDVHIHEHTTGASFDRAGAIASYRGLIAARDPVSRHEPLAALGESLALVRSRLSASGARGRSMDVGAYEKDEIHSIETDAQGRRRAGEGWAPNHLGDAIARLYERYAELLPAGAERTRAEATARAVPVLLGPWASEAAQGSRAEWWSSEVEFLDHRSIGVLPAARGEELLRVAGSLHELAAGIVFRIKDVLGLEPQALLVHQTLTGTDRASGGVFEFAHLALVAVDESGRFRRFELFDPRAEAEALARFDALTGAAPPPVRRRVRPNAASENAARLDAVVVARDGDALPGLCADDIRILEHTTGASFDRPGAIASYRGLITARDPASRHELLATLGESLALFRLHLSASGIRGRSMDVGAYEKDEIHSVETDAQGRRRAGEVWSLNHLGEAVARLYERYAEQLPEGPERTRAESFARSISAMASQPDAVRRAAVFAPDIEVVDHRTLGTWSARGAESALRHFESISEISDAPMLRDHDVLALEPDALLVLRAHTGVGRESGGEYERRFLTLLVAGADGRLARIEWFDAEREAEALARFDALVAAAEPRRPASRRVRSNGAAALAARFAAAFSDRDEAAIAALWSDTLEVVDHPTGASYGRAGHLDSIGRLARAKTPAMHIAPLATLGEDLLLARRSVSASGTLGGRFDVGAWERAEPVLFERDAAGRFERVEIFASDRLGDATSRLYARYAERLPEGPERARAARAAQSQGVLLTGSEDLAQLEAVHAPDFEAVDHRHLALWSGRASSHVEQLRSWQQVADDVRYTTCEILALAPDALLAHVVNTGTNRVGGGGYERLFLSLSVTDDEGRLARLELFDPEREAEALARFDGLVARAEPRPRSRRVRENAATRGFARGVAALSARDPGALAQLFDASLRVVHHPSGAEYGRREMLGTWRSAMRAARFEFRQEILASLGDALALDRHVTTVEGLTDPVTSAFGVSEFHELSLLEVGADGCWLRSEIFADDRLGDGIVRLYERHAELLPEGEERIRAAATARSLATLFGPIDLESWRRALAPHAEIADHRVLRMWTARNVEEYLSQFRHQLELAPDFASRTEDVLSLAPHALLVRQVFFGTAPAGGGAFENDCLVVYSFGRDGLLASVDAFEPDDEVGALTRFDGLSADSAHGFENAAARTDERLISAFNARDWPGVLACIAPQLVFDERRRMTRNVAEREVWLEQFRLMFDQPRSRFTIRLVATRGERLSLHRHEFEAEVAGGGGPLEIEPHYTLHEIDAEGLIVAIVLFDLADEADAYAELDRRFDVGEAAEHPRAWDWAMRFRRAFASRDWDALAALHAPDQEAHNHRLVGWGTLRGPGAWVPTLQQLVDLAPDVQQRVDHLRLGEQGLLWRFAWQGTREGGDFEAPMLLVVELDDAGRERRLDVWDPEKLDAALARFAAIEALATPPGPFENQAARAWRAVMAVWKRRDAERFRALQPRSLRYRDHRRQFRLDLDREQFLDFTRPLISLATGAPLQLLLGTRGERLALLRFRLEAAEDAVGPREIESLILVETDERGEIAAYDRYDVDDEEAAWAELDARFGAGEGAAQPLALAWHRTFSGALARRDWEALAATFAPSFVAEDRRLAGWGTLEGPARFVDVLRDMIELASDARLRVDHQRASGRTLVGHNTWLGTREGGAFEISFATWLELDAEGRALRLEQYDSPHAPHVLARFAELVAGETAESTAASPFANLATSAVERGAARIAARDWEGFRALFAPGFRQSDRTAIGKLETGRDEWLAAFREQIEMTSGPLTPHVLATRGERLVLVRIAWRGAGGDVGESEIEWLLVIEVDERGDHVAVVSFEPSDLAGAYRELDARFAACPIFAAVERTYAAAYRRDREACLAQFAPGWHADDHRRLGWGRTLDSAEMFFRAQQALLELAPDFRYRVDHFAVRGRAFLTQVAQVGTREGGPFESPFLYAGTVDERGLLARYELYDVEEIEAARARFEALAAEAPAMSPFANAATRAAERVIETWTAQDWESMPLPEGFRLSDRRRAVQLELDRDAARRFSRSLVEGGRSGRIRTEALATRGERLALLRWRVEVAGGDVGESEIRHLNLFEVDERGALRHLVRWDDDALEAALAELDARFEAGEGGASGAFAAVERVYAAIYRRDREALLAQLAPGFRVDDHRRLGWGRTLEDGEWLFRANDTLLELAPDFRYRVDHFAVRGRAFLSQVAQVGTREGGPFESPFLYAGAVDESGLLTGYDVYDVEEIEAGRARFDALAAEAPAEPRFANAATRAEGRIIAAWQAHDLEGFARQLSEGFHNSDRRRAVQLELDRDATLAFSRALLEGRSGRIHWENLATRGEHLALSRWQVEIAGGEVGESEIPYLGLCEVDEQGAPRRLVRWDDDALEAALAELEARFAARDRSAGASWMRAFSSALEHRDWDAVAALYAPDFVGDDHRLVSWGTLRGPAAFLESLRQMFALAPDARTRLDHVRAHERGVLTEACWVGTRDGGAFESAFVATIELAPDGRALRSDFYDPQHLTRALARFEEIRSAERSDPHAPFAQPNAASAWLDRFRSAYNARDWDAFPALYAPGVTYEDRQRLSLLSGGIEMLLSSVRERAETGARLERCQLLDSAGDRVAIQRLLWAGGGTADRFEMEHIVVQEVNEAGQLVATINFDLDDARAAQREAWARWAARDPVAAPWVALLNEITDAWNAHDAGRVRNTFADEIVVEDHRLAGIGRIESAAAYVDSFAALWDLAPDQRIEFGQCHAIAPHAVVFAMRRSGTLDDGGAFENEYAWLAVAHGGRTARLELFESEHLDAALARFEALRPDPLRVPPNASTRANDRWWALAEAQDWDGVRALTEGMVFEDRRRLIRLAGSGELLLADTRHLWDSGWRPTRTLLAVAGDRLSLERMLWTQGAGGQASEIEVLKVAEVDAEGGIVAYLIFDPSDRAAASEEMFERWTRQSDCWLPRGTIEFIRAWNRHDRAGLLAALPADYVFHDRRRTGIGRVEGAGPYVDSLIALWKLSPDVRLDFFSIVAREPQGFVGVGRWFGTNAEGGEFEALFIGVSEIRGERQVAVDLFEVEEMDAALARFEAICGRAAAGA